MTLLLKHKPKTTKDIIGNEKVYNKLINDLKNNKHKGIYVLSGPPGTGKSSFVETYCKTNKYKMIKVNHTDIQTKHTVKTFIKKALVVEIPFLNKKAEIKKAMILLRKSYVAVFIIVPEYKSSLFKGSNSYKTKSLQTKEVMKYLNDLIVKEEVTFSNDIIKKKLIESSSNDLRQMLSNFDLLTRNKKNIKYTSGTKTILESTKNDEVYKDNIYENIYKGDMHRRANAFYSDQFIVQNVIYEGVPRMRTTISNMADMYETLCDADILTEQQNRTQDYGMMPYINYINVIPTMIYKEPLGTPKYPGLFMKLKKKGNGLKYIEKNTLNGYDMIICSDKMIDGSNFDIKDF